MFHNPQLSLPSTCQLEPGLPRGGGGGDYARQHSICCSDMQRMSDYLRIPLSAVILAPACHQTRESVKLSLILCARFKIHWSDYLWMWLSADILRALYPTDNQTISVTLCSLLTHYRMGKPLTLVAQQQRPTCCSLLYTKVYYLNILCTVCDHDHFTVVDWLTKSWK